MSDHSDIGFLVSPEHYESHIDFEVVVGMPAASAEERSDRMPLLTSVALFKQTARVTNQWKHAMRARPDSLMYAPSRDNGLAYFAYDNDGFTIWAKDVKKLVRADKFRVYPSPCDEVTINDKVFYPLIVAPRSMLEDKRARCLLDMDFNAFLFLDIVTPGVVNLMTNKNDRDRYLEWFNRGVVPWDIPAVAVTITTVEKEQLYQMAHKAHDAGKHSFVFRANMLLPEKK